MIYIGKVKMEVEQIGNKKHRISNVTMCVLLKQLVNTTIT